MTQRAWRVSVVVALAAMLASSSAFAERTYKVQITTEPEGAKIFIDDPDSDPIGETPYDGDLAVGDYTLVFEAPGYETLIESISVKKSRRKQSFSFELAKKPVGFVKLRPAAAGDDFEGATILIDDAERDVGVDEKIELGVGAHKLEVVREGYQTFEAYFELEEGQLQAISVNFVPEGQAKGGGDGGGKKKDKPKKATAAAPAAVRMLTVWGGFEWAGRSFKYDDTATMLRDYDYLGSRFRLGGTLHPLVSMGRLAGGVGLGASVGLLLYPTTSRNDANTPTDPTDDLTADNSWLDYRIDLRYRYDFGGKHWVAGAVGYGQNKFDFQNVSAGLEDRLAAVDYKMLVYGVLGGTRVGENIDLFASFNLYQVTQAGPAQQRFTGSAVSAFGLGFGGMMPVYESLELMVQLNYDRFSYAFGPPPDGVDYSAESAVDQFFGLTVGVGYRM